MTKDVPPMKPKLSSPEQRARREDRLAALLTAAAARLGLPIGGTPAGDGYRDNDRQQPS